MARKPAARKNLITIPDLSDVDESGGSFHIAEGDYKMEVSAVELTEAKSSGNEMLKWTFLGKQGKAKNKKFYLYTSFSPESLWKLKQTLRALDVEIPDNEFDVDADEIVGLECVGKIVDDEYDGKTRSKLAEVLSADAADEEDEEDPKPARAAAKKNGAAAKPAAKGKKKLEPLDADEVKAMSEDELEDVIEKYGLDVDLSEHSTLRRKAGAVVSGLDGAEMLA